MAKRQLKPSVGLRPVPVVLVTCVDEGGKPNIVTLAWAGVVCSIPPMLSIAVRPERYSHGIIKRSGQFVVNLPTEDLLWAADYCGSRSGRDEDKFAAASLTAVAASEVKAPLIGECPINMECVVRHQLSLGSHDLFIGEVVALHADESAIDSNGALSAGKARLIAYDGPGYLSLGNKIGTHGMSRQPKS